MDSAGTDGHAVIVIVGDIPRERYRRIQLIIKKRHRRTGMRRTNAGSDVLHDILGIIHTCHILDDELQKAKSVVAICRIFTRRMNQSLSC